MTPGPSPWRTARRRTLAAALVLLVAAGAATGSWWWSHPAEVWADGSAHGDWIAVYDGHGRTSSRGTAITLSPAPASDPEQTHAGLVVSVRQYGDLDLRATVHTVRQLRTGSRPNPWEVGWLVWHYDAERRFYYFALKPNGWELGQVDPSATGGQRFLATGDAPVAGDRPHDVRVRQLGATIDVWVDHAAVVSFTVPADPGVPGAVGLYSEDAEVRFSGLRVEPATLP
ncbi:calcium-binding protein [Kineococcus aurantiacus]|uniref:DUF1080 domain-containing protein n=1 Tax=Kineococcus aurantiacus TaxID=37633 RepID=A0A7Y9DLP0_9ACTN|nr:calcium-binding protein [Kineococcus aurantiacus]NYD22907.1 hypothetical protein [Kineococcus aurantiacus]